MLLAAQSGHLSTVQTLVQHGARVGATDGLEQNALHVAAFEGHEDVVKLLLEAERDAVSIVVDTNSDDGFGAIINAQDVNGHTALILASLRGHHGIMRLLADVGAAEG